MLRLLRDTFFDTLRIIFVMIVIVVCIGSGYGLITGKSPFEPIRRLYTEHHTTAQVPLCNTRTPLNLAGAPNAQLGRLSLYQQACDSYVAGTMMTFVGIPLSTKDARLEATQVAATLHTFAAYKVRPLVVAEPTDYTTGSSVDMGQFAQGAYTSYLSTMFSDLEADHVTTSQMGIWNPFPEANLPYWKDNQPQDFAPSVNTYVSTLEQHFPGTQTSIMLNAATYPPGDIAQTNAQYVSLMPYIQGITPHTIDYAGLEGFPWLPPRGQSGAMVDAGTFLKLSIISQAAAYLGTKNIWLNTGTFSAQYTNKPSETAYLSPVQRQVILSSIDRQATTLQHEGYNVAVNLFAQNKSGTPEAINWSYASSTTNTSVATGFIRTLYKQHVSFWLFDQ